jgi:hypothetical protein
MIASRVYSEQVGRKRHDGGITRETVTWYSLIIPRASPLTGLLAICHPILKCPSSDPKTAPGDQLPSDRWGPLAGHATHPAPITGRIEQASPPECPDC